MIHLTQLCKTFPATRRQESVEALVDVDLHVERGEVMGVVGPSGSGKSTLARCINLLERPTSGSVVVDGRELTTLRRAELNAARRGIGMIFQHFNLLDSRTVRANVELPLELAGVPARERERTALDLLDRVGLADRAGAHPAQLSGGQRQRVAIARALAPRPRVLLCDEATSALDPVTTDSVLRLVRELTVELGLTTVLITHEMAVVKAVCDAATLLESGRVIDRGPLSEVALRPGSPLARRLLPHADVPRDAGPGVLPVTLVGEGADLALGEVCRRFPVDLRVLEGTVEHLGGQRVGRLLVELSGPDEAVAAGTAYLRGHEAEEAA